MKGNEREVYCRWHPERGEHYAIEGLEPGTTQREISRVWQGLRLLRRLTRPGRPPGSGAFPDRSSFECCMRRAIQALRRSRRKPTHEAVASWLREQPGLPSADDRQIREWLRTFGCKWQELLEQAGR